MGFVCQSTCKHHQTSMKNKTLITKTAFAVIAGLLLASASTLAQIAPPTPASVAPNYGIGSETSLIMPKPRANLYFDVGLQYLQTHLKYSDYNYKENYNFYGANFVFGWRIDPHNKIQAELSALGAYKDYGDGDEEAWGMSNLLFTYGFCVPLGTSQQWELRLSPSIGFNSIYVRYRYNARDGWKNTNDVTFSYGAGIGVTCHLSKRMYLDAGYRYLRASGPNLNFGYRDITFDDMDTHAFTFSVGWKF